MARSVRIEYPGAVYHIMCRGDRREPIFESDGDRLVFLETLGEACERAGFLVHSYALMLNHYHLLLETPEGNLVAGMKWFQGTYTQRYNSANGKSGHLFQGRYKAIPVDGDDPEYFRVASDYIHLNPARAGLLDPDAGLQSFKWSSYPSFISSGKKRWPWLRRERVFYCHDLPDSGRASRRRYAQYMGLKVRALCQDDSARSLAAEWADLRRGWYCGSKGFRDVLMERVDNSVRGRKRDSYLAGGMRRHDESEAVRLLSAAIERLDVSLEELCGRRQTDAVKQAVAWWIKSQTVVGDAWICRQLSMGHRMNISRAVGRYRKATDPEARIIRNMLICAD